MDINYKNNINSFTPVYDIWINGTKLVRQRKQCITSIALKEVDCGASTCTITISDPEFIFVNDSLFLEENKVTIHMGINTSTEYDVFWGFISAIDISFASDGIPTLTITCMDNMHRMNREKKNNTWKGGVTSRYVVGKIAGLYGYRVISENYAFSIKETISQSNQTDIEFLMKLAGDEVHPFSIRLGVTSDNYYALIYKKSGVVSSKPVYTGYYCTYPYTIISFSPKINKETKQVAINKSSIDTGNKAVQTTKSTIASQSGGISTTTTTTKSAGATRTYDPSTGKWSKNK